MPRRSSATAAKTLFLARHAKSSWKEVGLADRERPLSGRGKREAPRMGRAWPDGMCVRSSS